ncbi:vacuolar-sorting protein SNF8-like [Python bivittatus]|uniref:Vacuolar-sorting protein SNF8 n=1 Tax=Python bivittatus TaxID=176946 RepID=A0A9F2RFF6_PYTBI|nr:vacuolar-sorting protein SNF8-like [Python bivittatus]
MAQCDMGTVNVFIHVEVESETYMKGAWLERAGCILSCIEGSNLGKIGLYSYNLNLHNLWWGPTFLCNLPLVSLFPLGLIILDELHQQVLKGRGKFAQDVSQDDLIRAIKKLKVLGNGFGILPVGGTYLIQSVPAELNMDHTVVIQLAEKKGYVTISEIKSSLKWEMERAKQVLDHLLKEGMAWLDTQAPTEPQYWLPALFTELYSQEITPEEAKEALP